jgi:hypothetical protein
VRISHLVSVAGALAVGLVSVQAPAFSQEVVRLTVRVVDARAGGPLPEATVELSGILERVVTDESGEASFEAPVGDYVLTARRYGYLTLDGDFEVMRAGSFTLRMVPSGTDLAAPGRLTGTVNDAVTGRPIAGATLALESGRGTVTDAEGRFHVPDVTPGLVEIEVGKLGYAPRTESVTVQPGRTTGVTLSLAVDPLELEAIEVEIRSPFLEAQGVYRRMEGGTSGHIVTREEIDARPSSRLSDSLMDVPGLQVMRDNKRSVLLGRGRCRMRIFLDGVEMGVEIDGTIDIDLVPPDWVEVAEVYTGLAAVPVEYGQGLESCGVMLVWTRRRAR